MRIRAWPGVASARQHHGTPATDRTTLPKRAVARAYTWAPLIVIRPQTRPPSRCWLTRGWFKEIVRGWPLRPTAGPTEPRSRSLPLGAALLGPEQHGSTEIIGPIPLNRVKRPLKLGLLPMLVRGGPASPARCGGSAAAAQQRTPLFHDSRVFHFCIVQHDG